MASSDHMGQAGEREFTELWVGDCPGSATGNWKFLEGKSQCFHMKRGSN